MFVKEYIDLSRLVNVWAETSSSRPTIYKISGNIHDTHWVSKFILLSKRSAGVWW